MHVLLEVAATEGEAVNVGLAVPEAPELLLHH